MRRTFIIASVVIILAGVGVVVYFIFFAGSSGITVMPIGSTSFPVAGQGLSGTNSATSSNNQFNQTGTPTIVSSRLVKISAGPVVPGVVAVNIKAIDASSSPEVAVSYIERQSGNVFTYRTGARVITRTNNKTIE